MEEVLTREPPLIEQGSGRIYIMDRRETAAADKHTSEAPPPEPPPSSPPEPKELPSEPKTEQHIHAQRTHSAAHRRRCRNARLIAYFAAAVIGIAAGAAVGFVQPLSSESFSHSLVMSEQGGFVGMLLRRMLQCGAFLTVEYIVGYFAAGGWLVWIAPMVFGLGTGLSAAGAVLLGGGAAAVVFCVLYTAVIVMGADCSGGFSALLLRLVSCGGGGVVTDGTAAHTYTMQFCFYMGAVFFLAIAESCLRAVL